MNSKRELLNIKIKSKRIQIQLSVIKMTIQDTEEFNRHRSSKNKNKKS